MLYKVKYTAYSFPFLKRTSLTKEQTIQALNIICPSVQISEFCICTGQEILNNNLPELEKDVLFLSDFDGEARAFSEQFLKTI